MELLFGSRVLAGGRRTGYLAGVEIETTSRRVSKIIFSDDGKLGSHAHTRAIEAVRTEGRNVVIGDSRSSEVPPGERAVWSRAIRLSRDGRQAGHLSGVAVGPQGAVEAVLGRPHWWSPRHRAAAAGMELGPGEIRLRSAGAQAA